MIETFSNANTRMLHIVRMVHNMLTMFCNQLFWAVHKLNLLESVWMVVSILRHRNSFCPCSIWTLCEFSTFTRSVCFFFHVMWILSFHFQGFAERKGKTNILNSQSVKMQLSQSYVHARINNHKHFLVNMWGVGTREDDLFPMIGPSLTPMC